MATTTLMITMIKKEQHYDGWEMTFGGGFIILHERAGSNKPGGGHYLRNRRDGGQPFFFRNEILNVDVYRVS